MRLYRSSVAFVFWLCLCLFFLSETVFRRLRNGSESFRIVVPNVSELFGKFLCRFGRVWNIFPKFYALLFNRKLDALRRDIPFSFSFIIKAVEAIETLAILFAPVCHCMFGDRHIVFFKNACDLAHGESVRGLSFGRFPNGNKVCFRM